MASKNLKTLRTIDNNDAYQIVNKAYRQSVGTDAVETVDLSSFVDGGTAFESLTMNRDKFVKALIDQVVNFYNDTSYESEYQDPYYVESRRFANIVQMINAQAPEVQASHAWKNLAPVVDPETSQVTKVSIGTYEVNPPVVSASYYNKSNSWELPLAISTEQLTDAFKSEGELRGFVDFIFVIVDNALKQHRESLNSANRNAYMARKIRHAATVGTGIQVVNLLDKFNTERGGTISTVADFLKDPEALRYASAQIILYTDYIRKQSTLFNTEGLVKFVPAERLVLEVNSAFESAILETALSTTYHDKMLELPGHYSTAAWQGFGVNSVEAGTKATAFDQVSKIDVTIEENVTVSKSGIVAFMADKYAVMHTIRQERVAAQYFEMEDVTLYAYQNRDQYINNLAQNAIVFTLEAPVSPTPSEVTMSGGRR